MLQQKPSASIPAAYTSANSPAAYTVSYGAASVTTTATSNASYTNPAISGQYTGTNATPSPLMYQSPNSYMPATNSQKNVQPDGHNYSYGVTNYLGAGAVDPQNISKQSYPAYQMMPSYGNHNPISQYSYSMPQNMQHQMLQQQQMQQQELQNSSQANQNHTNFASAAGTYSTSYYTNAGHNVTPSSTVDGRNYMMTQQPTTLTHSSTDGSREAAVASDLYYMSPYGYQQFNPQTTVDRNAEQFVSRGDNSINEQTDRLQAKRNSMTYMQAGGAKNGSTMSTFSANSSSATTNNGKDADATPTVKKQTSNVDLLADLDFNVSDVPLMPSTPAPTPTKAADVVTETLNNMHLNNPNTCETQVS